jgi:acyl-CoA synthetase
VCRVRPGHPEIVLPALLDHLAKVGLSKKKWPEHLVIVDAMRVLPIGKIDKKAMAALAIDQLGRRRGSSGVS